MGRHLIEKIHITGKRENSKDSALFVWHRRKGNPITGPGGPIG